MALTGARLLTDLDAGGFCEPNFGHIPPASCIYCLGSTVLFLLVFSVEVALAAPTMLTFGPRLQGEIVGTVDWEVAFISPTIPHILRFWEDKLTGRASDDGASDLRSHGLSRVDSLDIGIGPGELPGNRPFQSFDGVSVVIPGDREPIAFGYFSEFANVTGLAGRFEAIRSPAISRF